MFAMVLFHGGILAFLALMGICLLFGDDKAKKEATKAGEEVAGLGCLAVIVVAILLIVAVFTRN